MAAPVRCRETMRDGMCVSQQPLLGIHRSKPTCSTAGPFDQQLEVTGSRGGPSWRRGRRGRPIRPGGAVRAAPHSNRSGSTTRLVAWRHLPERPSPPPLSDAGHLDVTTGVLPLYTTAPVAHDLLDPTGAGPIGAQPSTHPVAGELVTSPPMALLVVSAPAGNAGLIQRSALRVEGSPASARALTMVYMIASSGSASLRRRSTRRVVRLAHRVRERSRR